MKLIIFYLIGAVIALIISIYSEYNSIRRCRDFRVSNLSYCILHTVGSWISILVMLVIMRFGDFTIIKGRQR
jgi:hypothetical protein